MDANQQQVGRLAFRVEGDWWVAYYALPTTMDGAMEMARIRMALVQDQDRKNDFMGEMTGETPEFLTRSAPEHERSGRA
jgi:hypothetical protein